MNTPGLTRTPLYFVLDASHPKKNDQAQQGTTPSENTDNIGPDVFGNMNINELSEPADPLEASTR